jgi:hypothetical protein
MRKQQAVFMPLLSKKDGGSIRGFWIRIYHISSLLRQRYLKVKKMLNVGGTTAVYNQKQQNRVKHG